MLQKVGFEGLTKDFVVDHSQWVASIVKAQGGADQLKRKAKKESELLAHRGGERKRR
jgi:hypothetical protein